MKQKMNAREYEMVAQELEREESKNARKLEKAIKLLTTFGNLAQNNFRVDSKVKVDLILKRIDRSIYDLQDMLTLNQIDIDKVFCGQSIVSTLPVSRI